MTIIEQLRLLHNVTLAKDLPKLSEVVNNARILIKDMTDLFETCGIALEGDNTRMVMRNEIAKMLRRVKDGSL